MKNGYRFILSFVVMTAFDAHLAEACDQQAINNAQVLYDLTNRREKEGSGTKSNLVRAQKHLLDTQYCASSLTKETYCLKASIAQFEVIEGSKKQMDMGLINVSDYINDLKDMIAVKQLCK